MSAIAERITRLRNDIGLDQRTAAAASGLSQSTWSRIESGTKQPSMAEVVGVAHAVGALVSTVLGRGDFRDRLQVAARTSSNEASFSNALEHIDFLMELDSSLQRTTQ